MSERELFFVVSLHTMIKVSNVPIVFSARRLCGRLATDDIFKFGENVVFRSIDHGGFVFEVGLRRLLNEVVFNVRLQCECPIS
jgi:hypothetical protein